MTVPFPPVDLDLIFEKSSSTDWIFSLQKSIAKLIFAGYTGSKNPVRNRLKIQFVKLDFSKLIFQKLFNELLWLLTFELEKVRDGEVTANVAQAMVYTKVGSQHTVAVGVHLLCLLSTFSFLSYRPGCHSKY